VSEISLLPETSILLTEYTLLAHVEPTTAILPATDLTLVPNALKAITVSSWPSTLPQYFLDDGNYMEAPFPATMESPSDSGVYKTRKRFTGKFNLYTVTIWLESNTEHTIFMNFYYGQADQGNSVFTIPVPSTAGAKAVRFVPGTLSIVSDGGAGWKATFQLIQEPEAV